MENHKALINYHVDLAPEMVPDLEQGHEKDKTVSQYKCTRDPQPKYLLKVCRFLVVDYCKYSEVSNNSQMHSIVDPLTARPRLSTPQ